MKNKYIALFTSSFIFMLAGGMVYLTGCSQDAKPLYESKCGNCHDVSVVDNTTYTTLEEWTAVVNNMKEKTTVIVDDDAAKIASYLESR